MALVGCVETGAVVCDGDVICPEGHTCDSVHGGCASPEQLAVCMDVGDGIECNAAGVGDGFCSAGVCIRSSCGDGHRATEEICDGEQFATIDNCNQVGFYVDRLLGCTDQCVLDESMCTELCGDDMVNGPELCDGAPPALALCVDFGQGAGDLTCSLNCGADLAQCIPFGWTSFVVPRTPLAIHGTADDNVWVVGTSGMVQRFDGTQWLPIDVSACTTLDLSSLQVINAAEAYIADVDGVVHVTATGCTKQMFGEHVDSIFVASPNDIYGGNGLKLWHYNGTVWSVVDATPSSMLWATSANNIFRGDGFSSSLLRYNGQAWTPYTVPSLTTVRAMWGTADEFYAAGTDNQSRAAVMRNRGGVWSNALVSLPALGAGSYAVAGAGTLGHNYVVGVELVSSSLGSVYASDGTGWVDTGAPYFPAEARVWGAPEGTLYMIDFAVERIYRFEGTARLEHSVPPGGFNRLAVTGANAAYTTNLAAELWGWDGVSWKLEADAADGIADIMADSAGNLLVVGVATGVRIRTAFGVFAPYRPINGTMIAGTSLTNLFVLTSNSPTTIAHSNGVSETSQVIAGFSPNKIVVMSTTFAIAIGKFNVLYQWNGTTWSLMPAPPSTIRLLWGSGPTDVYATSGQSLLRFNGTVWSVVGPLPGDAALYGDAIGPPTDLFLATETGIVHGNGSRGSPIDTGDIAPTSALTARGSSLFWVEPAHFKQLFRAVPW